MRTLEFNVNGQRLSKTGNFSGIVRGSTNYLKCAFNFTDSDWNKCKIGIVFEYRGIEHVVIMGNDRAVVVPPDISDKKSFRVRVVGIKDNYKLSTNKVLVNQEG